MPLDEQPAVEERIKEEQDRARALALLEAVHQFPGDYAVTVIALNKEAVSAAIRAVAQPARAAIEPPPLVEQQQPNSAITGGDGESTGQGIEQDHFGFAAYESRPSREGKYLSHRFTVRVEHAQEVLDLYARLRVLEGVLTIL